MSNLQFAPGARIEVRSEEWLIRRVDTTQSGGQQLTCIGMSELVRDIEAIFLSEIDDNPRLKTVIRHLRPEETQFISDTSNHFIDSRLYLESLLRQTPPTDEQIHLGHLAAMDTLNYQLDPARQALQQPRQRILIADAVGLGKTLEAGILITELMRRGRGKRILVVTVKSMLTQFQKELWNRFTIPLTRLDSVGIQRVRNRIPTHHNPFFYYDKSIVSIDTLKQGIEYRNYLEQAWWDIIVIDEAHNVAERGSNSQRSRLARLLASRSDSLIMLSATPHDGSARSFASLLNMLDATAIVDPDNYSREDYADKGLVIRRFKKDIKDQLKNEFPERQTYQQHHPATLEEEHAFTHLIDCHFSQDTHKRAGELFKTTLTKALFSSPAACRETIRNRIRTLQKRDDAALQHDIDQLQHLDRQLTLITPAKFAKYQGLLQQIRHKFAWKGRNSKDRLVIFAERIETLRFLHHNLQQDLNLKPQQIDLLHGGLADVDQQHLVEAFGQEESRLRLLLCSDVASEGINLHHCCAKMIHFDIPWSLMVFQQRNGRIDRYGQQQRPQIVYLLTDSNQSTIQGDNRILEVLIEKDDNAVKNIGDPSAFMGVYTIEGEEQLTAAAMEQGMAAEEFDQIYQASFADFDPFGIDLTLPDNEAPGATEPVANLSLFENDYHYLEQAIRRLSGRDNEDQVRLMDSDANGQRLEFIAPRSLKWRFQKLSREIWPEKGHFILTANIDKMKQSIEESRRSELAWPRVHYLWSHHPVTQWINDKVTSVFRRQEAPVIRVQQGVAKDEHIILVAAQIPNRKGQAVIHLWYGVRVRARQVVAIEPFADVMQQTGLNANTLPNRNELIDTAPLQESLPQVVTAVQQEMEQQKQAFDQQMSPRLQQQLDRLQRLRGRHQQQLEIQFEQSQQQQSIKQSRKEQQQQRIEDRFNEYQAWIDETMTIQNQAYIQIIAALVAG
ncbi:MAG: DEAD/DEAH box helicase [Gammaproteobacteria bacterium]|nr:DEAD/DEAH box helicase [Gammaproteobacteria bacterium]